MRTPQHPASLLAVAAAFVVGLLVTGLPALRATDAGPAGRPGTQAAGARDGENGDGENGDGEDGDGEDGDGENGDGENGGSDVRGGPRSPSAAVRAFFGRDLSPARHGAFGLDRASVRRGAKGEPAQVLTVAYPARSASPSAAEDGGGDGAGPPATEGGAQVYLERTGGPVDEAWLSYRLRLPAGFDFVKGGKLPGLYGGRVTSGGKIPDGTDGFSTRYMWRAGGAGEVYAYLPSSVEHGTSLGRGAWTWPTGRWVEVVQHVRLNTPGAADGVLEVTVDGRRVLNLTSLTYRTDPELRIDGVFFSTFFGGGDASWATPVDQATEFADVVLGTRPPG